MDLFNDKIRFSINVSVDKNGKKIITLWPSNWAKFDKSVINKNHNSITVLTGKINNLTIIDFDEKGMEYFYKYEDLMDTYIEYSTRGFRHAYFEYDEELSSKIKVNNLDTDILSDGKCCITTTNNNGKPIKNT